MLATISSGGFHTCGLRPDGTAICWGANDSGQASPPEEEVFTTISSGWLHSCALREDEKAVCWGGNESGEASPPGDERFIAITSGGFYTCGLRNTGTSHLLGRQFPGAVVTPASRDVHRHRQWGRHHLRTSTGGDGGLLGR